MAAITNREDKKQALRSRVVDGELPDGRQRPEKRRPGRIRVAAVVLIVFLLLVIAGIIFVMQRQYKRYSVNWTQSFGAAEGATDADYVDYVDYALCNGGMVKLTRDGASFVNASGKTVWNQAYEMRTPIISVNGEYCAIADQGQNQIFIMNAAGTTGQAQTTLPIVRVSVSARGVVYALMEDATASYISVFSKEGVALDISIKSVLSGDGYPVDISISPDGTECIASFVYLENGTVQNKVIFYNLDEIGKNAGTNRVVGGFIDDFKGHMVGRVHFSDNTWAQAFYDGGIAFFSTKVLTSPELVANVPITETIRSIAYTDKYAGVVTENSGTSGGSEAAADGDAETAAAETTAVETAGSGDPYRLTVYRLNGQKVFERTFNFSYTDFVIDGDSVILSSDNSLQLYNMTGRLKFDGALEQPIVKAGLGSGVGANLLIGSTGSMESIKLK